METKIERENLLGVLANNMLAHRDFHEEAMLSWKAKTIALLEAKIEMIKNDQPVQGNIPSKPESHENEYKKIIRMIEMDTRESIQLSEHEFEQYVLDEWTWKHLWEMNVSQYVDLKK